MKNSGIKLNFYVYTLCYVYPRSASQLRKNGQELGCPRQDLDDGEGRALADTVEHFAHNLKDWINSFVVTFTKMQANGYSADQLRTQNLDVKFFTQYN